MQSKEEENASSFITINNTVTNILQSKCNVLANEHNEEDKENAQHNEKKNKKNATVKCREHKPKAALHINKILVSAIDLEIK